MIEISYRRAELPAPHLVPRMEYRFPQMISQGPGLRPTPKGCGPGQSCCADCQGATAVPVQQVSGLGRLALGALGLTPQQESVIGGFLILGVPGALLAGYHGYRRHRGSVGAAIGWGALGLIMPILTTAVALAQGYGEPMRRR